MSRRFVSPAQKGPSAQLGSFNTRAEAYGTIKQAKGNHSRPPVTRAIRGPFLLGTKPSDIDPLISWPITRPEDQPPQLSSDCEDTPTTLVDAFDPGEYGWMLSDGDAASSLQLRGSPDGSSIDGMDPFALEDFIANDVAGTASVGKAGMHLISPSVKRVNSEVLQLKE